MLGSRKTLGAAIIPDTALRTAASPQPSANIQLTRTPSSRLVSGPTDAARMPSPIFVKRKNAHIPTTPARHTASVPRSCWLNATPPTRIGFAGNGLGNARTSGPQIQPARPFSTTRRPIVIMTTVSTGARSTGRMITRCSATPPTKAIRSVVPNASQYVKPWLLISDHAMNVVNIPISPCAKLMIPVAR